MQTERKQYCYRRATRCSLRYCIFGGFGGRLAVYAVLGQYGVAFEGKHKNVALAYAVGCLRVRLEYFVDAYAQMLGDAVKRLTFLDLVVIVLFAFYAFYRQIQSPCLTCEHYKCCQDEHELLVWCVCHFLDVALSPGVFET